MHSGERITVGITATAADGDTIVVPALSEKQLTCVFGRDGASLYNIIQITLDDLSEHLKESPTPSSWESPFSGISLGEERDTLGNSLTSVVQNAMRLAASFSAGIIGLEQVLSGDSIAIAAMDDDRWPKQIQEILRRQKPGFEEYFNRSVEVVQGARPAKFDFLGRHYVANFGKLIPYSKRLSTLQLQAKAKLWDLARLREAPGTNNISAFELILWRPSANDPAYSEKEIKNLNDAILELTEEAKREDLFTIPVHTAEQASEHIIIREAA